jgi:hypothetical protein
VQAANYPQRCSQQSSAEHRRLKWIHARFWSTWSGSLLLMTMLGPLSMGSVLLAHQWSISGMIRSGSGNIVFALIVSAIVGIFVSIPVAVMLCRRRPAISLMLVYGLVYCITLAWPHYFEFQYTFEAYNLAYVASAVALCISFTVCLVWLVFDWHHSRSWMWDFEVRDGKMTGICRGCGYILHSCQVNRCSECGAAVEH